jgi:peptidyl-dipeptidase Dcp
MKLYVAFRGQEPSIEPLLERSGLKDIKHLTAKKQ